MSNKRKLSVAKESKTGLNTHFRTNTGKLLTRGQVADNIDKFPGYHVVKQNNKRVIRSNPDNNKDNNLD